MLDISDIIKFSMYVCMISRPLRYCNTPLFRVLRVGFRCSVTWTNLGHARAAHAAGTKQIFVCAHNEYARAKPVSNDGEASRRRQATLKNENDDIQNETD